ncbi:MAG: hypothetical protein J6Y71_00845 [Ruminococcus sp.]|nr:hypothetical protein [Ruminococcus sp.]
MPEAPNKKKLIIVITGIIILLIVPVLGYLSFYEYPLITCKFTDFTDISTVYQVNNGTDYVVLKTLEGTAPDQGIPPIPEPHNRNVEQAIMVKDNNAFIEYLTKDLGCAEINRLGGLGYYETKSGKKFTLSMALYEGGFAHIYQYAVEQLYGMTIEEIIEDSKS